jgi:hypothetical protein
MSAKTPIRTVFNASDVATGLAEYQSGEFIPLSHGGIGAALSIGSAGQVLKVNSGASALEFGSAIAIVDIDSATNGSSVTLAASDKFLFSDGGTEKYLVASQIDTYVSGTSSTLTNKTLTAPTINGVIGGTTTSQTISTLTATTIAAAGSITLDVVGDILLDADGGDVFFMDGGTKYGSATNNSGNLIIKSGTTTALTMSGANVTVAGNLTVQGTTTTVDSSTINVQNSFVFEGATADAHETNLTTIDPTADRTVSIPNATGTIVLKDTTDTLTNKSIDLGSNTLTGSLAEFNSALQSESFVGLAATQTLTNKTLTSPTINTPTIATPSISAPTLTGIVTATGAVFAGASPLVFEGATANAFETTFAITDPTADRTVTIQDASGTVAYLTDITGGGASEFSTVVVNTSVIFEGSTDDGNETTLVATDPTADRTITIPNATGTFVLKDTTDTLTNKSINSDNNTITNLVNADIKASAAIAFSKMADLTASRALVSDGNGDVSISAVTATEIGYLDGVTSSLQTQLNATLTTSNGATRAFAIAQAVALG